MKVATEEPAAEAEEVMWRWTVSPEKRTDAAEYLELIREGRPVAYQRQRIKPTSSCQTERTGGSTASAA